MQVFDASDTASVWHKWHNMQMFNTSDTVHMQLLEVSNTVHMQILNVNDIVRMQMFMQVTLCTFIVWSKDIHMHLSQVQLQFFWCMWSYIYKILTQATHASDIVHMQVFNSGDTVSYMCNCLT